MTRWCKSGNGDRRADISQPDHGRREWQCSGGYVTCGSSTASAKKWCTRGAATGTGPERRRAPLDVELGIDGCFGFSPLMTYLICMLGADEAYAGAAAKLEAMPRVQGELDGVQRTTKKTGERIPMRPTS